MNRILSTSCVNTVVPLEVRARTSRATGGTRTTKNITSNIGAGPRLHQEILASRSLAAQNAALIPPNHFQVYTDGSGFRGGVGGAARARTPLGTLVLKEYLGSRGAHQPVEGEILGVILGLQIIKTVPALTRATILVDCQQAIRELVSGRSKHVALLDRFYAELSGMGKRLGCIHLVWVPGHEGIMMNEKVDKDAKEAASGERSIKLYF